MNKNFSVAWNMVKKRSTCQRKVTKTNAEISLTTSFLAQELLNELFVRALAGAKLVLAGAEMVNLGVEPVHCETKLSNQRAQVAISRQALRGRRGRLLEFPKQHYQRDARQREHSLRRGDRKAQPRRRGHLHVAGALERAVQLERRADGRGRVLRSVALNRELLGCGGLGLVEAAETVAVKFQLIANELVAEATNTVSGGIEDIVPSIDGGCLWKVVGINMNISDYRKTSIRVNGVGVVACISSSAWQLPS